MRDCSRCAEGLVPARVERGEPLTKQASERERACSARPRALSAIASGRIALSTVQPDQAPNANAHAERFVRSIKEECLNRLVPLGDRHFRLVIAEYLEHYHRERNHQGLDSELIAGAAAMRTIGPVRRRARLGGLLNYYARAA